jgi:hypothetical protein
MFTFVEEGTAWADSGFILVAEDGAVTLGTTKLTFTQFSAAGQTIAGAGLTKNGDTINIVLSPDSGLTVNADSISISSSIAGAGLTWTAGMLNVVGTTNRISVSDNAIDISTSYAGQASIVTVGTITTGTWQGTAIGATYGGTGQTGYSKGDLLYSSDTNVLAKRSIGTAYKVLTVHSTLGVPVWSDIDGGEY